MRMMSMVMVLAMMSVKYALIRGDQPLRNKQHN